MCVCIMYFFLYLCILKHAYVTSCYVQEYESICLYLVVYGPVKDGILYMTCIPVLNSTNGCLIVKRVPSDGEMASEIIWMDGLQTWSNLVEYKH